MLIRIPYGRDTISCRLQDERVKAVLRPEDTGDGATGDMLVRRAMEHPIASPRLSQLARGKQRIVIIASDHTRPVPSKAILPPMLEEIKKGSPDAQIKVLMATGFHRASSPEELERKFGDTLGDTELVMHNARDRDSMVCKGLLPSGGELWLNRLVDWAELIVSEGFIEPHFFAGFSGGRKSILPGIASQTTVFANHCSAFIAHPNARTGVLDDNPIHRDMVFAARTAGLGYIVNVVLDEDKRIIAAYAGDPYEAHAEGCRFVARRSGVNRAVADIVITSNGGDPLDQNIYQSVKGMTAAEACVRDGGVIILCAACGDGHGGEAFYRWFSESGSADAVVRRILSIPQMETLPDQWQAQILARVLLRARVIMVCGECSREYVLRMGMLCAQTLEKAVELADLLTGGGEIVVIPDGVGVIVHA